MGGGGGGGEGRGKEKKRKEKKKKKKRPKKLFFKKETLLVMLEIHSFVRAVRERHLPSAHSPDESEDSLPRLLSDLSRATETKVQSVLDKKRLLARRSSVEAERTMIDLRESLTRLKEVQGRSITANTINNNNNNNNNSIVVAGAATAGSATGSRRSSTAGSTAEDTERELREALARLKGMVVRPGGLSAVSAPASAAAPVLALAPSTAECGVQADLAALEHAAALASLTAEVAARETERSSLVKELESAFLRIDQLEAGLSRAAEEREIRAREEDAPKSLESCAVMLRLAVASLSERAAEEIPSDLASLARGLRDLASASAQCESLLVRWHALARDRPERGLLEEMVKTVGSGDREAEKRAVSELRVASAALRDRAVAAEGQLSEARAVLLADPVSAAQGGRDLASSVSELLQRLHAAEAEAQERAPATLFDQKDAVQRYEAASEVIELRGTVAALETEVGRLQDELAALHRSHQALQQQERAAVPRTPKRPRGPAAPRSETEEAPLHIPAPAPTPTPAPTPAPAPTMAPSTAERTHREMLEERLRQAQRDWDQQKPTPTKQQQPFPQPSFEFTAQLHAPAPAAQHPGQHHPAYRLRPGVSAHPVSSLLASEPAWLAAAPRTHDDSHQFIRSLLIQAQRALRKKFSGLDLDSLAASLERERKRIEPGIGKLTGKTALDVKARILRFVDAYERRLLRAIGNEDTSTEEAVSFTLSPSK